MADNNVLAKAEEIEKEKKRLKKIYKNVDKQKLDILQGFIEECAFMRATLKELRIEIDKRGVIDEMPQGEYSILRESPYVKTYHAMIQKYATASDKLLSLLPKEERAAVENDGFDDFVNGREDI